MSDNLFAVPKFKAGDVIVFKGRRIVIADLRWTGHAWWYHHTDGMVAAEQPEHPITRFGVKDLTALELVAIANDVVAATKGGHTLTHTIGDADDDDGQWANTPPKWVSLDPIRHLFG